MELEKAVQLEEDFKRDSWVDTCDFHSKGVKELVDKSRLHALDCLALLLEDEKRHIKA